MRTVVLTAAVAAFLAVGILQAEEGEKKRGDRPDGARKAELIKQFDKDEDGKLNEEERAAARAAWEKRRAEGGQQAEGRRRQGRPGGFDRAAMLKKFDKDESGDLNEEERAALKQHIGELRAKRGEGQGRPQGRQGRGRPGVDREKIIAEFDKDEDGKLNEEERAAARAAMRERFQKRRAEQAEKKREGE